MYFFKTGFFPKKKSRNGNAAVIIRESAKRDVYSSLSFALKISTYYSGEVLFLDSYPNNDAIIFLMRHGDPFKYLPCDMYKNLSEKIAYCDAQYKNKRVDVFLC